MATTQNTTVHPAALELAELLTPAWAQISAGIPAWHPRCEDSGGDGGEGAGDGAGDGDDAGASDKAGRGGEGAGDGGEEPDWKSHSRKHETRAKAEKRRADELQAKLDKIAEANQSDQEKAISKTREEARTEALTEAQKERRSDRLEVAVHRLATKGIKVGDELAKFADPEDVLTHLERAIARGDLSEDDIFDSESKVQTDALTAALSDLAERKPHWLAGTAKPGPGENDAGKGSGGSKSLEDMSVEEHLARKRRG